MKKRFLRYSTYAEATMADLFPPAELAAATHLEAFELSSGLFENVAGRFRFRPLPIEAQVAPVRDLLVDDFDADGRDDLLLVGNAFDLEVETGRIDAFNGLFLRGVAGLDLAPVHPAESGFKAPGDARSLARLLRSGGTPLVVVGRNDAAALAFSVARRTHR